MVGTFCSPCSAVRIQKGAVGARWTRFAQVTAFQQQSKHSGVIQGRIEMASHLKSCQNVTSASRMSRNASRLLPESNSMLKEFSWNALQMPSEIFDSRSNAARTQSRFVIHDVFHNTTESYT